MRTLETLALVALTAFAAAPAAAEEGAPLETISLPAAIERAAAHNPSTFLAAAEVRRADALVQQVRASSLPTLGATGLYTRLDGDRVLSGSVVVPADVLNVSLTAQVPLVAPQAWMAWSHATDERGVAQLQARDVKRQVAIAVARTYLTLLAQHRVVELNERARDTAQAHFDFAHTRLVGGLGVGLDEARARQELDADRALLQAALLGLTRAREALGVVVGSATPLDVAAEPRWEAPTSLPKALASIDELRPDLVALGAAQRSAERRASNGWTDYLPSLTAIFQPFYQTPATFTVPTTGWQAQLLLTQPIYDAGLRAGLAQERDARLDESHARLEAAERQARADVRIAFEAVARADEALLAARSSATAAHEALAMATKAYRAGASSNLEVIDAERRARDADTGAVRAEDGARQARLDLLVASGQAF